MNRFGGSLEERGNALLLQKQWLHRVLYPTLQLLLFECFIDIINIFCWDCPTRGLDAASAFDFVKSLRIVGNTLHKTNVVTMYQVSDSMYSLFDKVLLLDKGRYMYYGPANRTWM